MDMALEYDKEREGIEYIKTDDGFVVYNIGQAKDGPKECYLRDCYILPDRRKMKLAYELVSKVESMAKEQSCDFITTSIDIRTKGSNESLQKVLQYGFKLHSLNGFMIILSKDLKNGQNV